MGTFYTYLPQYDKDGKIIVGADGQPILTDKVQDTGKTMNNDWTGGVTTAFSYKGIKLSAALDIRKGGYMFSRTKNNMQFTGNGTITTYNDRQPFIIPNSIQRSLVYDAAGKQMFEADGVTPQYKWSENTTPLFMTDNSYQTYFNDYGYGHGGEAYLVDRSFVKLRNITLSWTLPRAWVSRIYLTDITISAFCNNVFTWTAKDNYFIDPEVSSYGNDLQGQFGELYSNPSCRVFGCNLNVKF